MDYIITADCVLRTKNHQYIVLNMHGELSPIDRRFVAQAMGELSPNDQVRYKHNGLTMQCLYDRENDTLFTIEKDDVTQIVLNRYAVLNARTITE
jgi:hypothetical protein